MRIALDAMGTDSRPLNDIAGGVLAANEFGDTIVLVGDESRIKRELQNHQVNDGAVEILHAPDAIAMDEKPTDVLKANPSSSIYIALDAVKRGEVDAFVTMGNTGAVHAIATLKTLRRIPGVKRPVLSALFPVNHHRMIFLDVGANADVRAEWVPQFAIMGSIYAQRVLNCPQPRIALLSNGAEDTKGNLLIRESVELLRHSDLNFVGNVEPVELMGAVADVIVMDGFVGNIVLKMFEATANYVATLIRQEFRNDMLSTIGGALAQPAFKRIRRQVDTSEVGGAPLLGVNGVVIIGHGQNSPIGIKNAIQQARTAVREDVIGAIRSGIAQQAK
ncbi:MAG: phosphate acyltransferase PlsX [Chloroflexi bacterium]|nr:phosphate acyltransferase PlsX [Chloroflexota bacterium]